MVRFLTSGSSFLGRFIVTENNSRKGTTNMRSKVVFFALFIVSCGGGSSTPSTHDGAAPAKDARLGCGIGALCQTSADCRTGLACLPSNTGNSYCSNPECAACFGSRGGLCTYDIDTCAFVECLTKHDGGSGDAVAIDAGKTCAIGTACSNDGDCVNGLTCQKYDVIDGLTKASSICAPPKCATCNGQTCVVDSKITCGFVECRQNDGDAADAKLDSAIDKPATDALSDKPKADAGIDAPACTIAKTCATNGDCSNGLICQKFDTLDGQAVSAKICMPAQCLSCGQRACVYDGDPKVCGFVECESEDAGVADTAPVDVTPVPFADMPTSMAATCQVAASAPCGGDLIGDWEITGVCDKWLGAVEFLDLYGGNCPTWGDYTDSGDAFFHTDGSCLISELSVYQINKSQKCLQENGMSCSSMNQTFKDAIGDNHMVSGACAISSGDTCHCEKAFSNPDHCQYVVTGTSVTTVGNDGSGTWGPNPYCVEGDRLTLFFDAWSAAGKYIGGRAGLVMRRKMPVDAGIDAQ